MYTKINKSILNIDHERSFIDQARRAQIIRTAINLIADEGYGRCSLARIAKRAGISVGVIAYHFQNKDELIEAIVQSIYEMATSYMLPRLEGQKNALEMLRGYIASNVEFIAGHPREMMTLAEIFLNYRDTKGKLHYDRRTEEPILANLKNLLNWGQETGEFRLFDLEVVAITIRRAIDAIPPLVIQDGNFDASAYARELETVFEKAVKIE